MHWRDAVLAAAIAPAMLLGCATGQPVTGMKTGDTGPDGRRVVCKKEMPVGSHIPEVVCHPTDEGEAARTQADLNRPRPAYIPPGG